MGWECRDEGSDASLSINTRTGCCPCRAAENPKWGYNRTAMEPFLSACGSPSGPGAFFTAARHVGHIDYGDILIRRERCCWGE